ncbi:MAG: SpoIIE family protein phosphatase, partial [Evtepia sp.]
GITGFLCLADKPWGGSEIIFICTEVLFTAVATYFYRIAFEAREKFPLRNTKQTISFCVVGGTVLIALSGVMLLGELSLGRIIAAVLVLMIAEKNMNYAILSGISVGVLMDLASGLAPYYTMIYALAGLASGFFRTYGKIMSVIAFAVTGGIAVLWTWESGMRISLLYEIAVAAGIFLFLPNHATTKVRTRALVVQEEEKGGEDSWTKRLILIQMKATAHAFRELYETLRGSFSPERDNGENVAVIFERTADRICRRCPLRDACWQRDYVNTQTALNDATVSMMERGRAIVADFPMYFTSRCLNFTKFISSVNEEMTAFLARRQKHSRMRENRAVICQQYAELDQILGRVALELGAELAPDVPRQKKLAAYLHAQGIESGGVVYYDRQGHLRIETPVADVLLDAHTALAELLGIPLREAEKQGDYLVFAQAEPFVAMASVSAKCKEGETVSGDAGTWFRRADGILFILLCDGMGSGEAAREESNMTVRLLQNFLKAGIEPEAALATINSALTLRGEETAGCTTVDLLTIELYTGQCSIYKLGAAPTYLRKNGKINCMAGSALPAGAVMGEGADVNRFRGESGDWILLLTDGVLGGDNDAWLRHMISEYDGKSPGELAEKVMKESKKQTGGTDDGTVIAVRLEKRS